MTRLSREMRNAIVTKAVAGRFRERSEALAARIAAFGDTVYAKAYGEHEAAARKLPESWIHIYDKTICIVAEGWDCYGNRNGLSGNLPMSANRPMPDARYVEIGAGHPCEKEAAKIAKEYEALRDAKEGLRSKLMSLLLSCNTIKQLKAAWPEGAQFYEFAVPKTYSTALVPVTLTRELNAILGIKKAKGTVGAVLERAGQP